MKPDDQGPGSVALARVTSRLMGWLTVLTAPAWVHGAVTQAPDLATWWNVLAFAMVGAAATALLVEGWAGAGARWPAVSMAGAVAVAVALWGPGVTNVAATQSRLPWLWLLMPLALSAMATLGSLQASGAYAVVVGGAYTALRLDDEGGSGDRLVVALEWGLVVVIAVGLALLVTSSRAAARRLDVDAHQAFLARTEAAGLVAGAEARAEIDAVLHDRVLAALLLVVRSPGAKDVAILANEALAALEGSAAGQGPQPQVDFDQLAVRVVDGVRPPAPEAAVVVGQGPTVPEAVARAVVEATAEAVRNSVRHAVRDGHPAPVTVNIGGGPDPDLLTVRIRDDGQGFDPLSIPPERLGLAVSVVGRMRSAGGIATVASAPGQGTTVTISWPSPVPGGAA